ncbi:hypothetical protein [Streptomyces liangshanensis]|uniref:hypothetical protein n=1 Tax=Streptomyces liangshanensis TaxID=2717324 RepID=UPI0036D8E454
MMDRIRGGTTAAPARTTLPQSHAAQLLIETALRLEAQNPFVVLAERDLDDAVAAATTHVLADIPPAVAARSRSCAAAALPPTRYELLETAGEYALRLRAVARGL